MKNSFRKGLVIIGNTQIGNSANIKKTGDNMYEEELGDLVIKYYYDNEKNLIADWKKNKNSGGTKFKEILETILPTINKQGYVKCDMSALDFHELDYKDRMVFKDGTVDMRLNKSVHENNYYSKKSNKFGAEIINDNEESEIHFGVDFSYGRDNPISCIHPQVFCPVDGIIDEILEYKVVIKQNPVKKTINGKEKEVFYYHTIEHLHKVDDSLSEGMEIKEGELLGLMGGASEDNQYQYYQHVHYDIRMKDKYFTGKIDTNNPYAKENLSKPSNTFWRYIDPEKFWDFGIESGMCDFKIGGDL